jgi:hypothetical protein
VGKSTWPLSSVHVMADAFHRLVCSPRAGHGFRTRTGCVHSWT